MKKRLLGIIVIAVCTSLAGEERKETMREALAREYHFAPKTDAEKPAPTTNPDRPATNEEFSHDDGIDTVVLDKMTVVGHADLSRLEKAINAPRRPDGPQNSSKFGTGIHERDFGKVRVSVVTILFIPVFISASW